MLKKERMIKENLFIADSRPATAHSFCRLLSLHIKPHPHFSTVHPVLAIMIHRAGIAEIPRYLVFGFTQRIQVKSRYRRSRLFFSKPGRILQ
jgi:hypothetical protein